MSQSHTASPRGRSVRRLLATLATLTLGASALGCQATQAQPVPPEAELAPYQLDAQGRLHVREDLKARLVLSTVALPEEQVQITAPGSVVFAPDATYAVRPAFSGFVESVPVRVGHRVETGDLLAVVRSSELARTRAEIRRIEAALRPERDTLERTKRLVSAGAASRREVIEAEGNIAALTAELTGHREALKAVGAPLTGGDRLELRALRAGDVLARNIQPGEHFRAEEDDAILLIGDAQALQLVGRFPERDAALLDVGSRCNSLVPALGRELGQGTVVSVNRALDPGSGTISVVCEPERAHERLRAAMRVQLSVAVASAPLPTVPRQAVLLRRDDRVVLVSDAEGRLERRAITTGMRVGGSVQILAGLEVGEQVVSQNAVLLDGELDQLL